MKLSELRKECCQALREIGHPSEPEIVYHHLWDKYHSPVAPLVRVRQALEDMVECSSIRLVSEGIYDLWRKAG